MRHGCLWEEDSVVGDMSAKHRSPLDLSEHEILEELCVKDVCQLRIDREFY